MADKVPFKKTKQNMGMKGNKDRNVEKNIEKDKSRGGKEANK